MATPSILGLTAMTPKVLFSGQLASGDNALYTSGAAEAVKLNALVLCNTSGAAVTISAGIIPSGGSVDGTHKMVSGYSLAAGETVVLDEFANQFLDAGAKINVNVSAAAVVDATVTGVSMT